MVDEPVSAPPSLIISFTKASIFGFFDLPEPLMIVELFRLCVSPPSLVRCP